MKRTSFAAAMADSVQTHLPAPAPVPGPARSGNELGASSGCGVSGKALRQMQGDEILGGQKSVRQKKRSRGRIQRYVDRVQTSSKSTFRMYWDAGAAVVILFVALELPFRVAFVSETPLGWRVVDLLIDIQFIADVLVNCCTAPVANGEGLTSVKTTALHYSRHGLVTDLLSAFPFDRVLSPAGIVRPLRSNLADGSANSVDVARVVKLLRLLSVARLYRYANKWEVRSPIS